MTNGLSHPYHLDESTFNFRGIRSSFSFLFHCSMNFMSANRIVLEGTASRLELFCLPMPLKKGTRLIIYGFTRYRNCTLSLPHMSIDRRYNKDYVLFRYDKWRHNLTLQN